MKKIVSILLTTVFTVNLIFGVCVYAKDATVKEIVYKNDLEAYEEGTTGDSISANIKDGLVIRNEDKGTDQVLIVTDRTQGKVLKYGPGKTSYDGGFSFKKTPVTGNNPTLSFKLKPVSTGSTTWCYPGLIDIYSSPIINGDKTTQNRICRLRLYWGSNGGTALNTQLQFRNETAAGYETGYYVAMGFADGTPGWLDVKMVFDHSAQTYDVYVNGELKATGQKYFDSIADNDIAQIMLHSTDSQGYFLIDDVEISADTFVKPISFFPEDGAQSAELADILSVTYNKENLDAAGAEITIAPTGESAVNLNGAAYVDEDDSRKICIDLSRAGFELNYGTEYTVKIGKVVDESGDFVRDVTFSFKTREPQLIIGNTDFNPNSMGKMEGSVEIINENREKDLKASVIFAAFQDNELKDAAISTKTVGLGSSEIFAQVLEYNAGYEYRSFVWDDISKMHPIANHLNAEITNVSADMNYVTGKGGISGALSKGGVVTMLMLKPDCIKAELPSDGNLADKLAYIGEANCENKSEYNEGFVLNLGVEENGKKLAVFVNTAGDGEAKEAYLTYYSTETANKILSIMENSQDGSEIEKMLAGQTEIDGIYANDILKFDIGKDSDYAGLKNKSAVCNELAKMRFKDIDSVHTAFKAAVAKQKAAESGNSDFSEIYYNFEPKGGIITPQWGATETTNQNVALVEPHTEVLPGDKTNTFWRFNLGGITLDSGVDWRTRISLDKAVSYNDTPKVISFKFRLDGGATQSNLIEMLDSTASRGTKEFIFNATGNKVYQKAVSTGTEDGDLWHITEIVMDATGKLDKAEGKQKKYIFVDGQLVQTAEIGKDANKTVDFNIKHIQMYSYFPGGTTNKNYIDFDDLKITEYKSPGVLSTQPQNGEENVDITNKIKVVFDKPVAQINAQQLSLYGGDGDETVTGVGRSIDNKTATFTLNKNLKYDALYTAIISGIKDDFSEEIVPYTFKFKTRAKMLVLGEANYTERAGKTDCSVTVTNETESAQPAVIIFAAFDGDRMTDIKLVKKTVAGGTEETFSAIIDEENSEKVKMFAWNAIDKMQPLKMTNDALVRALHIQKDYINGDGKITVKLADSDKDTAVQLLMLKPGVKLAQVNEENASETIAYVTEIMCDKGGVFRANYITDLSQADIQERKSVEVYAGAKGMSEPVKTSFICYDAQTVDNVLSAVREAQDGESIRKIIEGDILVSNVKANDVLHFWIDSESEYENLKDRAGACKLLKKETFTNLQQIRTAFDAAVLKQLEYEENVTAALQELNNAKWDEMSGKLFQYAALLELDLTSGYYSKLNKNGLIQIHKQLANTYTFAFGADINKYIDDAAKVILTAPKPEGGGGGGGGTKADTKMELSGISIAPNNDNLNTPEFSDLDGVLWAKESIAYLARKGIINGVGNNMFAPNDLLTREQLVKIIVLVSGAKISEENTPFSDVNSGEWFMPYVSTAVKLGLVNGIDDKTFGSGRNVSRQDMAVFLMRLAKTMGVGLPGENDVQQYTDGNDIADYARDAVYIMRNANIMNGMGDNSFLPNAEVSRAMAAKAVFELLHYGNKE